MVFLSESCDCAVAFCVINNKGSINRKKQFFILDKLYLKIQFNYAEMNENTYISIEYFNTNG